MELWKEIEKAHRRIRKVILRTPIIYSDTLSHLTGREVFLKLENLQKTGSFKIRGAYHLLSKLSPSMRRRGVVAASAGNHAQGVAYASSLLNIASTIIMPEGASIAKQMATQSYGGEVILFGRNTDEALHYARKLVESGKFLIHPFDDEDVIAGQGTIGLEILEDVPEVEGSSSLWWRGLISGMPRSSKEKPKSEHHRRSVRSCSLCFFSFKKRGSWK
jgi:threonine dehydratase